MTPSIRLNPRQHGVNLWWNRDGIDPRQPMSALGHKRTFEPGGNWPPYRLCAQQPVYCTFLASFRIQGNTAKWGRTCQNGWGLLVAIALVGATLITVPKAFAQNAPRYMVSAVDLEIAPAQLDKFLEALRENGASTIKEPGCRQYDILQLISEPNQIYIYEVYENEAAVQAHRASDHFKKYRATTKNMMVKSQSRPMVSVATYSKPR